MSRTNTASDLHMCRGRRLVGDPLVQEKESSGIVSVGSPLQPGQRQNVPGVTNPMVSSGGFPGPRRPTVEA
jgi:hypothetical protein